MLIDIVPDYVAELPFLFFILFSMPGKDNVEFDGGYFIIVTSLAKKSPFYCKK